MNTVLSLVAVVLLVVLVVVTGMRERLWRV